MLKDQENDSNKRTKKPFHLLKSVDDIQCVQKVDIYTTMHGLGCKLDTDLRIIQCQDSSIVWNNLSIIWQQLILD